MNRLYLGGTLAAWVVCGGAALADTFGSGANSFQIDFVTIGNPGNPADTTGSPNPAGAVFYEYRIGKYEISEQMIDKANSLGGLGVVKETRGPDKPAMVRWFDAAKFVNWLNTSTGSVPAYKFVTGGSFQLWQPTDPGYDPNNRYRNKLATYFLPSVDEWYKAAYFDQATGTYFDYPTGSNSPPTAVSGGAAPGTAVYNLSFATGPADIMFAGGLSPYRTMAQGGNVSEWEETEFDLINNDPINDRGVRGGVWFSNAANDLSAGTRYRGSLFSPAGLTTGFRVGSIVPEPTSASILLMAAFGFWQLRVRHRYDAACRARQITDA